MEGIQLVTTVSDWLRPDLPECGQRLDLAARWTSLQLVHGAITKSLYEARCLLQELAAHLDENKNGKLGLVLDRVHAEMEKTRIPALGGLLVSEPLAVQHLNQAEHLLPSLAKELLDSFVNRVVAYTRNIPEAEARWRDCLGRWKQAGLHVYSPAPGQAIDLESLHYQARCTLASEQTLLDGHGPYFVKEVARRGLEIPGYGVLAKAELLLTDNPEGGPGFLIPPGQVQA
jgi:hypothetical protein